MQCLRSESAFTFVGETGSGKTELSVNWAIRLAAEQSRRVCFFDMDQTKGLFRARDLKEVLTCAGVEFFDTVQFQDSPIVPKGVTGALEDPENICVFDVGGNTVGSRMIGQYFRYLNQGVYFYVINANRPFSDETGDIAAGMERILGAGRIPMDRVKIISNPCMGRETTAESILQDHGRLTERLRELNLSPSALTVAGQYADQVKAECPVYPIQLYVDALYKT